MSRYRKKPVVVDAWQWLGTTFEDAKQFVEKTSLHIPITISSRKGVTGMLISTFEGNMIAQKGDWIIKGVKGEVYPCKPDIFEQTYEDDALYLQKAVNCHEKLVEACHNLAETMGIDVAIGELAKSENPMVKGAGIILKGIQQQAREALKDAEAGEEKEE
jgi:hypothetical protein